MSQDRLISLLEKKIHILEVKSETQESFIEFIRESPTEFFGAEAVNDALRVVVEGILRMADDALAKVNQEIEEAKAN